MTYDLIKTFLMAQIRVKNPPAVQKTQERGFNLGVRKIPRRRK